MNKEKENEDDSLNITTLKMQKITSNHDNAESKLRVILAKKKAFNNNAANDNDGPSL